MCSLSAAQLAQLTVSPTMPAYEPLCSLALAQLLYSTEAGVVPRRSLLILWPLLAARELLLQRSGSLPAALLCADETIVPADSDIAAKN